MQLTRSALYFRWRWASILALVAFAILAILDTTLKAATGYGTVDLQGFATAEPYLVAVAAWASPNHAILAGFDLGFDYLFMPLYAAAFYFGAIVARDAFTPAPGFSRRAFALLAAVPVARALFDAAENALEALMLIQGPTDQLADIAFHATFAKTICFVVGLLLWGAGVVGWIVRRKTRMP